MLPLHLSFHRIRFGLAVFVFMPLVSVAFGQSSPSIDRRALKFDKPLKRQIQTNDTHEYRFALRQGQGIAVEVEELDVNVKVELLQTTDKKMLATADLGLGFEGETLTFVAGQSGEYLLRVGEAEKESGRGTYRLTARFIKVVTEQERRRIEAEQLLAQAIALKKEGTADKMRDAIGKREQALALWQNLGDRYWESHTLKKLGESHYGLFEFGKALNYLNRSLLISKELSNKRGEASTLQWLGLVIGEAGDREKANAYFHEAFALLKNEKNNLGMAILFYWLASNSNQQGDKPKSLSYYNQALPLAQGEANKGWQANVLWGLGQVADAQNEKPKALDLYHQAYELWKAIKNEEGEGLALQYIGKTYLSQGEAQKALENFNRALALFRSLKNKIQEALTFFDIRGAYQQLGNVEESIEATKQTLASFQGFNYRPFEITMLGIIAGQYNLIGKPKEAIQYAGMAIATEAVVPEGTAEPQKKSQESQMRQSKAMSQQAIALAYNNLGEREKALLYYQQTLATFEEDKDSKDLALTTLVSIGQIYGNLYNWDEALRSYEKALSLTRESHNKINSAFTLIAIGNIYLHRSEYRNALERFEQVQKVIQEIKSNANSPADLAYVKRTEAGTLNNIALCYDNLGEPQKALDYYNQSLTIRRETSDKDEEAATLNNIGSIYSSLGDYQKALEYVRVAQETFRQASPAIKASVRSQGIEPNLLNSLGYISRSLGDLRQALDYYDQALSIAGKRGLKEIELSVLNNIGGLYYTRGELRRALEFFQRSLAISREIQNKEGEITTLSSIGTTNKDLGNKQEALQYLNQALELARAIQNKQLIASLLFNIGQVYLFLDDTKEALNYYHQALLIQREIGDKKGEALTLADSGFVHNNLGERQQALGFYHQAIAITRGIGDKTNEAILLGNFGTVYLDLGENQRALDYYDQSLKLAQSIGDKQTQAIKLTVIGKVQLDLGDKQKALATLEQALALCRENEYNLVESGVLINLGKVHSELGDKQQALQLLTDALRLARRFSDRWNEIRALSSMGKVYLESGEQQKARDSYNQSLLIAREIGDRDGEALAYKDLMLIWKSLNNPRSAILYGKQAVNKYQELRGLIRNLQRQTQEVYRGKVTDAYRELANLLISEGRLPEAQAVLDLLKEAEFRQLTRGGDEPSLTLPYSKAEDDAIRVIDNLASLGRELSELRARQERVEANTKRLNELEMSEIPKANAALYQAIASLTTTAPDVEKNLTAILKDQDVQDVLPELGAGTVALYTVIGKTSAPGKMPESANEKASVGWILLVTPEFRKAYPIDMTDFAQTVFKFREALLSPQYDPRPLAQALYRKLFLQTSRKQKITLAADLETYLGGQKDKTLMWSLDSILRYVPMAVLHDGKHYLVEKYRNVVFNPKSLKSLKDATRPGWEVLGLGVSEAKTVATNDGKTLRFRALVGAEIELRSLVKEKDNPQDSEGILPGLLKMNKEFTRQSLFEGARTNPAVIHIASHVSFDATNPAQSFLLLGDSKRLDISELRNFPTLFRNVDLLSLSACDTATGGGVKSSNDAKETNGEEIEGFAYLAQYLGAKAVMASLWQVSDEGTKELMLKFYQIKQAGAQLPKAEALRLAQLALLNGNYKAGEVPLWRRGVKEVAENADTRLPQFHRDDKAPYAHPYFWAPFVLIGNWK
jgi:tetratricopeptide (TPR) repeat protein